MKSTWIVKDHEIKVAVCDTEAKANKFIKNYPNQDLQKMEYSIVADVMGDRLYYY